MSIETAVAIKGTLFVQKHWKKIVYALLIFILLVASALLGIESNRSDSITDGIGTINGKAQVPDYISQWRPLVEEYTKKYEVEEYTEFLLALIYQELGTSDSLDIMQSSESLGLPPNTIQDPARSVDAGVSFFKQVLTKGNNAHVDFETIVQSYNFGMGYIDFVAKNGGHHTQSLAQEFATNQANRLNWEDYGDPNYVVEVMTHLSGGDQRGNTSVVMVQNESLDHVLDTMTQFQGEPYVWAGDHPSVGFDCSGLMMWAFSDINVDLPRTAQQQYNASEKIPMGQAQPGDLVFFEGTYETSKRITHVGLYLGEGRMFNANGSGIGFDNINSRYWGQHFVGFGRVADFG